MTIYWKRHGSNLGTIAELGPVQWVSTGVGHLMLTKVSKVTLRSQRLAMDFGQNGISSGQWPPLSPSWRLMMTNYSSDPSVSRMQIFSPSAAPIFRNANLPESQTYLSAHVHGTNRISTFTQTSLRSIAPRSAEPSTQRGLRQVYAAGRTPKTAANLILVIVDFGTLADEVRSRTRSGWAEGRSLHLCACCAETSRKRSNCHAERHGNFHSWTVCKPAVLLSRSHRSSRDRNWPTASIDQSIFERSTRFDAIGRTERRQIATHSHESLPKVNTALKPGYEEHEVQQISPEAFGRTLPLTRMTSIALTHKRLDHPRSASHHELSL